MWEPRIGSILCKMLKHVRHKILKPSPLQDCKEPFPWFLSWLVGTFRPSMYYTDSMLGTVVSLLSEQWTTKVFKAQNGDCQINACVRTESGWGGHEILSECSRMLSECTQWMWSSYLLLLRRYMCLKLKFMTTDLNPHNTRKYIMCTYTFASLFVTNCSLNISGLGPFSSSKSCTPDFTAASSLTCRS